jgi:mannosyltransferase OCH1-like enzyme
VTVHRYWEGTPDPAAEATGRRLLELNPSSVLIEWTRRSIPADVAELIDATSPLVYGIHRARHAANIVRLWALLTFGGVWVDYDVTPLAPFDVMPTAATAAHHNGLRCNCWLSFPKGHDALERAMTAIRELPTRGRVQASTHVAGERFLEQLWGDEVGRVKVRRDVDGTIDPDAPVFFDHAGRTANR